MKKEKMYYYMNSDELIDDINEEYYYEIQDIIKLYKTKEELFFKQLKDFFNEKLEISFNKEKYIKTNDEKVKTLNDIPDNVMIYLINATTMLSSNKREIKIKILLSLMLSYIDDCE